MNAHTTGVLVSYRRSRAKLPRSTPIAGANAPASDSIGAEPGLPRRPMEKREWTVTGLNPDFTEFRMSIRNRSGPVTAKTMLANIRRRWPWWTGVEVF